MNDWMDSEASSKLAISETSARNRTLRVQALYIELLSIYFKQICDIVELVLFVKRNNVEKKKSARNLNNVFGNVFDVQF